MGEERALGRAVRCRCAPTLGSPRWAQLLLQASGPAGRLQAQGGNNGLMQAATPMPSVRIAEAPHPRVGDADGARAGRYFLGVLGSLGLVGVLATVFLLAAGAAGAPS